MTELSNWFSFEAIDDVWYFPNRTLKVVNLIKNMEPFLFMDKINAIH